MDATTLLSTPATTRSHISRVKNERTAGYITQITPSQDTQTHVKHVSSFRAETDTFTINTASKPEKRGFGLRDIIDIINPLHHIPFVGALYRGLTNDQITATSRIIGGGLFGGVAGAANGVVSAIVTHETGKEPLQHVADAIIRRPAHDTTTQATEIKAYNDLPISLLAFAENPLSTAKTTTSDNNETPIRQSFTDNRTAGSIPVYA